MQMCWLSFCLSVCLIHRQFSWLGKAKAAEVYHQFIETRPNSRLAWIKGWTMKRTQNKIDLWPYIGGYANNNNSSSLTSSFLFLFFVFFLAFTRFIFISIRIATKLLSKFTLIFLFTHLFFTIDGTQTVDKGEQKEATSNSISERLETCTKRKT